MKKYILYGLMFIVYPPLFGQTSFEVPTTNTRAKIQQRIAATDIEVTYNRPNVKGREIFGGLVPYGQVWRTGSDASTKLYFSTAVALNDNTLDSGNYELFTIPTKNEWTIILQKSSSQWGSYSYKEGSDVLRFPTRSIQTKQSTETFIIGFENVTANSVDMFLEWSNVKVPIHITIDLRKTVVSKLEGSLLAEGRKPYFRAAMFYFENDLDINRAAELMALAINENPKHLGMLYRQALIFEKQGKFKEAIESSEKSLNETQQAGPELKSEYTKLNNTLLARLRKK